MAQDLARVGITGAYEGALKYAGNPELISRTHFARFLVEVGVCRDTSEVFRKYLTEGKPGFVPHRWATLHNAVHWITEATDENRTKKSSASSLVSRWARFTDRSSSA